MVQDYKSEEIQAAHQIYEELSDKRILQGIDQLRILKEDVYAAIPAKKRQSQGITWVLQRISALLVDTCGNDERIQEIALILHENMQSDDILIGVPIFMMGEYGKAHPMDVLPFFEQVAMSENWVVREFAAAGFHKLIKPNREIVQPWLKKNAHSDNPYFRRFVSETLRPVTDNRWMNNQPEYSLSVLRLLFRESHPYPRTSVGNNLSDLSRRNPELVLSLVQELVLSEDKNSYLIAYRACRNLVKKNPLRVMDLLRIDEYHYKDRNFYRSDL